MPAETSADNTKGLDLARLADLPEDMLEEGRRVATTLAAASEHTKAQSKSEQVSIRRKALLKVCSSVFTFLVSSLDTDTFGD